MATPKKSERLELRLVPEEEFERAPARISERAWDAFDQILDEPSEPSEPLAGLADLLRRPSVFGN